MKSLKFTKKQYEQLLKLTSLGEGMLLEFLPPEDKLEESELCQYLLANAHEFDLSDWVEKYDDPSMGFALSIDPGVEVMGIIQEYNEMIFQEYLIDKLAWRDAYAYFMKHLMSPGEYTGTLLVNKHWELLDEYNELYDRFGLEILQFVKSVDPQLN